MEIYPVDSTVHLLKNTSNQSCKNSFHEEWEAYHLHQPILCTNIKLCGGRTTHCEVCENHLNRLKRVEKLYRGKSQPIFSKAFQMGWCTTFGFPTAISDFPIFVNGKYPRSPVCYLLLAVIRSNNGYCCKNSDILIDACVTDWKQNC